MLWWKILGAGNGGFIFMIMNNNVKRKIKANYKTYKIFEPKIIIMDQLYSKSKTL